MLIHSSKWTYLDWRWIWWSKFQSRLELFHFETLSTFSCQRLKDLCHPPRQPFQLLRYPARLINSPSISFQDTVEIWKIRPFPSHHQQQQEGHKFCQSLQPPFLTCIQIFVSIKCIILEFYLDVVSTKSKLKYFYQHLQHMPKPCRMKSLSTTWTKGVIIMGAILTWDFQVIMDLWMIRQTLLEHRHLWHPHPTHLDTTTFQIISRMDFPKENRNIKHVHNF